MSAESYSGTVTTANQPNRLGPLMSWSWRIGTIATGCLAIFAVEKFDGPGLIFVLVTCLCFLIVAGMVGTRREQRRRGARIEAALSARRRASAG